MAKTRDPIQEMLLAARRTQILDAATTVFAEKGFHRATIKDIARMAGIADGTIYGLLLLQLLGDQEIAQRWEDLPDVLTTLFFDGLHVEENE